MERDQAVRIKLSLDRKVFGGDGSCQKPFRSRKRDAVGQMSLSEVMSTRSLHVNPKEVEAELFQE